MPEIDIAAKLRELCEWHELSCEEIGAEHVERRRKNRDFLIAALTTAFESLRAERDAARAEALDAACKAMCPYCAMDLPMHRTGEDHRSVGTKWYRKMAEFVPCAAVPIRKLQVKP